MSARFPKDTLLEWKKTSAWQRRAYLEHYTLNITYTQEAGDGGHYLTDIRRGPDFVYQSHYLPDFKAAEQDALDNVLELLEDEVKAAEERRERLLRKITELKMGFDD